MFHLLQCSHHQGVQNYKKEIIYVKVMGEILGVMKVAYIEICVCISVGKANSESMYV